MEAIIIGTGLRQRLNGQPLQTAVDIGAVTVQISHSVKSLGVTIDDMLSFINQHVDNVCKATDFHLRALRYIRR